MTDETPTIEAGMRVTITGGFYEGRSGETVRMQPDGKWFVRLDDYGKMALVNPEHIEIVTN